MGTIILLFAIVGYLCLAPSDSCPATCQCITTARPSADCSYRELMHVPVGFPKNLNQLTLSVNSISELNRTSFAGILKVASLWLTYNKITIIHPGTFQFLTSLMSLDLSHNQLNEFPWTDLSTLGDLELLNLNSNQLVTIPFGAFNNSRSLRSLQLSSNQLYSLPEGLFDPLTSLSHVQLYKNFFHCSCSLAWLIDWIQKTRTTVDKKREITCLTPNYLKDMPLDKVPDLQCRKPLEIMSDDPIWGNTLLLCKEVEVPYLLMQKDENDIEVAIRKFKNGTVTVTPVRQGTAYLCRVSNYTKENTGEVSVTLAHHQISGWQVDREEKLLLLLVSGKGRSITNAEPSVMTIPTLFWQALIMVLWHKVS
ncbi:immunoglobulin superfamily containing leucine-rich repeat protein 2-like [Bufo bufo]|uniref:immunoglobulin superfamily containing leucine-rich repeat protein 2-like n=1 Tax=Bufo bufo TaxID=8384 RepID=UPI001ABDB91B|nr:immunoglobulin superfamily containing leucine-rich repeat protein 2-like [Bufo bufo]XP_040269640.1 immunoglobulin superfamily containing leucine-rich repeat protein 2-like [Bufo bufo]